MGRCVLMQFVERCCGGSETAKIVVNSTKTIEKFRNLNFFCYFWSCPICSYHKKRKSPKDLYISWKTKSKTTKFKVLSSRCYQMDLLTNSCTYDSYLKAWPRRRKNREFRASLRVKKTFGVFFRYSKTFERSIYQCV